MLVKITVSVCDGKLPQNWFQRVKKEAARQSRRPMAAPTGGLSLLRLFLRWTETLGAVQRTGEIPGFYS